MHPGSDPMGAPGGGFASRRPNAPSLPTFELPPPPQKYPYAVSASPFSHSAGGLASVGNLLTPPSTIGGDAISPAISSASSVAPSYTSNGAYAWSPSTQTNYGFQHQHQHHPHQHQHQHQQQQQQQQHHQQSSHAQQSYQPQQYRGGPFSPLNTVMRNHTGVTDAHASTSSYEISLPPFPQSSAPMSAPATLATMAPPHHPQHQVQQQQQQGMLGSHTPVSASGQHPSPVHAQEPFRPPPTPQYYSHQQSGTPQHSAFSYSSGPSPTHSTPLSAGGQMSRSHVSPASSGPAPLSAPPVQSSHYPVSRAQYPGAYQPSHHGAHGPVLTNLSNPSGPPMLMGGLPQGLMTFNSGHAANMQHMYNANPRTAQPPAHNERPFKCDQCVQSFNRNHDLKRHKRIHLAVKPFPCGHCDKSFSRKDALKRHILVKGCGKAQVQANADAGKQDGSQSPADHKTETHDVKPI